MDFRTFLKSQTEKKLPIIFDGGMGTMIQSRMADVHEPELLNFTHPEIIEAIHTEYVQVGCNIITTNTFGSNPIKLGKQKYSCEEINAQAIALAKKACGTKKDFCGFVALDISSTGKLLAPMGDLSFDDAYASFAETAKTGEKAGADLVLIETMSDLYEAKAAILAVKENTSLPILVSMTFQGNLRTLTGSDVETCVTYLESLGVDALGFNCGGSLEDAKKLADQFLSFASIPVLAQPNAGIPTVEKGKTLFKVSPEEFAATQQELFQEGVTLLGGCCGTTPAHIKAMVRELGLIQQKERDVKDFPTTKICSYGKTVAFGNTPKRGSGPVIIGERINPTGKKKCKEALLAKNMNFVLAEAACQIEQGAAILDVNVGLPGVDEIELMDLSVRTLQKAFDVPLQLDSSEASVLEKAMRYYNGKPLINSVNGKQQVMDEIFPLVKKYGGSVVALCLDEEGIPPTSEGRIAIAEKILAEAEKYGIKKQDILIDTLTLTVSSQQEEALETIKAIGTLKSRYGKEGLKTVLGVSNISFGLPRREIINSHFFSMALYNGLDACIINPLSQDMMNAFNAYNALSGFDKNCLSYIETYTGTQASTELVLKNSNDTLQEREPNSLIDYIVRGYEEKAAEETALLLEKESPLALINEHIVPALDIVGKEYESGKKFLPQLLLSAQTVGKAFELIKEKLQAMGESETSKGKILLATVQGDIHDIGKNIVKAMLENYGYEVFDLGKDVPPEIIVKKALDENIRLIGLSALMTTTVSSMERTISLLRETEKQCGYAFTVMVGGAVLTEDYAKKIGADFYVKDAIASVNCAKKFNFAT